jgi:hypothetical protein
MPTTVAFASDVHWKRKGVRGIACRQVSHRSAPRDLERILVARAMMKCIVATIAIVAIAGPRPGAAAQGISPTRVYEGDTTIQAKNGSSETAHVSVQSWAIAGQEQEIPVQGFYVAHLLSGQILTTIQGQTTQHLPGDYWPVKGGVSMRVQAVGEVAVLETTVVSKK